MYNNNITIIRNFFTFFIVYSGKCHKSNNLLIIDLYYINTYY